MSVHCHVRKWKLRQKWPLTSIEVITYHLEKLFPSWTFSSFSPCHSSHITGAFQLSSLPWMR